MGQLVVLLHNVLIVALSSQYYPDEAWNRTILSLKIFCNQKEIGCGWTGEVRDYEVTNS